MTPLAKKLLILSSALMGVGLLFLGILPAGGMATGLLVLFPTGAAIFGVFLTVRVLGNEAKEFDREEARNLALADAKAPDPQPRH